MPAILASHPDAVLLFAGDGPLRDELERATDDVGVAGSVRFLGDRTDVPGLLAGADVFVFPTESEACGVAALEAAAAGLPIVTFDIEPFDEWLADGESGYVAKRGDAGSLAEAVLGVLADPEQARRMGERNRSVVEHRMDVRIWADRLADVYRRLV